MTQSAAPQPALEAAIKAYNQWSREQDEELWLDNSQVESLLAAIIAAYSATIRAETVAECAKVADSHRISGQVTELHKEYDLAATLIAEDIRKLALSPGVAPLTKGAK